MKTEYMTFGAIVLLIILFSFLVDIPTSQQNFSKAPELVGNQEWINSQPLKIDELKGKVVLIDFWTYSCINCIRTLPFLKNWYEKYSDKGLVIIGVHTPEFEFEKDYKNVLNAVKKFNITYPVVQDNNYETWKNYKNNYWPRKYLINKEGYIVYDHIGEGAYSETEKIIVHLLGLENNITKTDEKNRLVGTPELYLGYKFARAPLGNFEGFSPDKIIDYKKTEVTQNNIIYLTGKWQNNADNVKSIENSTMSLKYNAKDVNIVAGGFGEAIILFDGLSVKGNDLIDGKLFVNGSRLYNIISAQNSGIHRIDIIADPGIEIYTFTFG